MESPTNPLAAALSAQPVDRQSSSPLFRIPAELRTQIFTLALTASPDLSSPYPERTWYTRPSTTHSFYHTALPLLRTCRLIYLETFHLPLLANWVEVWCEPSTGPDFCMPFDPDDFKFAPWQWPLLRLKLYTQMCWIEGHRGDGLVDLCKQLPTARSVHVVVRWSDWWGWEQHDLSGLEGGELEHLRNIKGLKEVVVEMEAVEKDLERLREIADELRERNKGWGREEIKWSTWNGVGGVKGTVEWDWKRKIWKRENNWSWGDFEDYYDDFVIEDEAGDIDASEEEHHNETNAPSLVVHDEPPAEIHPAEKKSTNNANLTFHVATLKYHLGDA